MISIPKWPNIVKWRDPRLLVRLGLGALLLANVVVALIVFKPWAASAEEMERQVVSLQRQVHDRQIALEKTRALVNKIESARAAGDNFLGTYFMSRRRASSTIVSELTSTSQQAGIRQKEVSYVFEPIEGSDTLSMITVNANYEGTFADLMHFINLLDRSPKFLILESLAAAPQQSGLSLNVALKLNGFVREGADSAAPEATETPQEEAEAPAEAPPAAKPATPEPKPAAKPAGGPPAPKVATDAAPPQAGFAPVPAQQPAAQAQAPQRTWRERRIERERKQEKER